MVPSRCTSAAPITPGQAPSSRRGRRLLLRPCPCAAVGNTNTDPGDADLQSGLHHHHPESSSSLPRHVAVVMDGNTRWARARGLAAADGHTAGGRNLERIVGLSRVWGIRTLTAFVCSQENLNRPKAEVDSLMGLSEWFIGGNIDKLARQGIRLQVIGDTSKHPVSLRRAAEEAAEATQTNAQLHVILAIGYSGRWDVVRACRELARAAQANDLTPDDIDETLLAGKLATAELSDPDLVIRTGGELRLSNFLLWQSAYSELYFTDTMWPDFGETEYLRALRSYQSRDRRFGKHSLYL